VQREDNGAEAQYRLLETIRQYGTKQLRQSREKEQWREQHRDWCLALAEQAEPETCVLSQTGELARLERENDNVRTATDECLAHGTHRRACVWLTLEQAVEPALENDTHA
jgi:predicted ATPase